MRLSRENRPLFSRSTATQAIHLTVLIFNAFMYQSDGGAARVPLFAGDNREFRFG
jgi:hypothetical protein